MLQQDDTAAARVAGASARAVEGDDELFGLVYDAAKEGRSLQGFSSAELDAVDEEVGSSAIILLSRDGETKAVKALIAAGASVDVATEDGKSALLYAIEKQHLETIKALIDGGANVDCVNDQGTPVLLLVIEKNRPEIVKLLIDGGANVNAAVNGRKPIMLASARGDSEMVTALIDAGGAWIEALARTPLYKTIADLAANTLDEEQICLGAARHLAIHGVGQTLDDLLAAAERLLAHARELRKSSPGAADAANTLSERLQLIAAASLDAEHKKAAALRKSQEQLNAFPLPPADAAELLQRPGSNGALEIALRCEAKVFTMQPAVEKVVRRTWIGPFMSDLDAPWWGLPMILMLNVLVSPTILITAIYPPLTKRISEYTDVFGDIVPSFYLLSTPIAKFYLASACECALAILITLPPTARLADLRHAAPLLAWAISSLIWELRQLVLSPGDGMLARLRAYASDRFNRIDLPAIAATLAALLSAIVLDGASAGCGLVVDVSEGAGHPNLEADNCRPPSVETRTLRAIAACLLWIRTLRLLLLSSTLGPFVLTIFGMLTDVIKFLAVLVVTALSFAAALYSLYEPSPTVRLYVQSSDWPFLGDEPSCVDHMQSFSSTLIFLLESSVTGADFFACARDSTNPVGGWIVAFVFYAILALLLLNMLIAMMAKTFDNMWEASHQNYLFLKAQMAFSIDVDLPAPPPLYLLTLPYDCWLLSTWCQGGKDVGEEEREARANQAATAEERMVERNAKRFKEYIRHNQDDVAMEERWRTLMKKDMSNKFMKLERLVERQEERQHEQVAAMKKEVSAQLEKQLEVHGERQQKQLENRLEKHEERQRKQLADMQALMSTLLKTPSRSSTMASLMATAPPAVPPVPLPPPIAALAPSPAVANDDDYPEDPGSARGLTTELIKRESVHEQWSA